MTWNDVPSHDTSFTATTSCFPLCAACWTRLETPAARLPYYRALWQQWVEAEEAYRLAHPGRPAAINGQPYEALWEQIQAAVGGGH